MTDFNSKQYELMLKLNPRFFTQSKQNSDFRKCREKFSEMRIWCLENNIDPWAFRQAMILESELDTMYAFKNGISRHVLEGFDIKAHNDAVLFIRKLVREGILPPGIPMPKVR